MDARVETYLSSVYARARARTEVRAVATRYARRDRVVRSFAGAHQGRRGIHSRDGRARERSMPRVMSRMMCAKFVTRVGVVHGCAHASMAATMGDDDAMRC